MSDTEHIKASESPPRGKMLLLSTPDLENELEKIKPYGPEIDAWIKSIKTFSQHAISAFESARTLTSTITTEDPDSREDLSYLTESLDKVIKFLRQINSDKLETYSDSNHKMWVDGQSNFGHLFHNMLTATYTNTQLLEESLTEESEEIQKVRDLIKDWSEKGRNVIQTSLDLEVEVNKEIHETRKSVEKT